VNRSPSGKQLIDKTCGATGELGKALPAQNQKRRLEIGRAFEARMMPLLPQ